MSTIIVKHYTNSPTYRPNKDVQTYGEAFEAALDYFEDIGTTKVIIQDVAGRVNYSVTAEDY